MYKLIAEKSFLWYSFLNYFVDAIFFPDDYIHIFKSNHVKSLIKKKSFSPINWAWNKTELLIKRVFCIILLFSFSFSILLRMAFLFFLRNYCGIWRSSFWNHGDF